MNRRNSGYRGTEEGEWVRATPGDREMDYDWQLEERRRRRRARMEMQRRKRRKKRLKRAVLLLAFIGIVLFWVKGMGMKEENGEGGAWEMLGSALTVFNNMLHRGDKTDQDKPLIVIDPGHGGVDTGCSRDGVMESGINLQIANRLAEKLQELGFETLLLRQDDETDVSLEDRVAKTASAKADLFVSIHQNAVEEDADDIKGIETWYYEGIEGSERLAELVHQQTVEKTGAVDRGTQNTTELYVLRNNSVPACLIETAFLSSRSERRKIADGEYQEQIAQGIAQGIVLYFNFTSCHL